jgi:hypothetical protein
MDDGDDSYQFSTQLFSAIYGLYQQIKNCLNVITDAFMGVNVAWIAQPV